MTMSTWWADRTMSPQLLAHYEASYAKPWRVDIVRLLRGLPPWWSLYEVGCHCGPMLHAVQAAFPAVVVSGCDVHAGAVEAAQQAGYSVTLGAFPGATRHLPDQSVDVLLSCYTLAYVPPESIVEALNEAARLARVAIVLCEPVEWDYYTGRRHAVPFAEYKHPYLYAMAEAEGMRGWNAECHKVAYEGTFLSGLIAVVRS